MKKVTLKNFLLIVTAGIFFSCTPSLLVNSDYDKSANFSAYKTFSLYNLSTSGSVSKINADRIASSIKKEMISKGFTENKTNPDLMVNAVTVLKDKIALSATTNYYGYGGLYRPYGYWAPAGRVAGYTTVSSYEYKDGSLIIDVVDAKTEKMIWQGTASAEIQKKPKNPEEVIGHTVTKIMSGFPLRSANN
jgi:Domain of unknown function (DUF4136)